MLKLDMDKRKGSKFFPGDKAFLVLERVMEMRNCYLCECTGLVGGKTCPDCDGNEEVEWIEYVVVEDMVHALLVNAETVLQVMMKVHCQSYHSIHAKREDAETACVSAERLRNERYIQLDDERREMYLRAMRVFR